MKTKNEFKVGQSYKDENCGVINIVRVENEQVYYMPHKKSGLIDSFGMYFLENSVYAQRLKLTIILPVASPDKL